MLTPWKESYDQPRQPIKKQRYLKKIGNIALPWYAYNINAKR